MIYDKLSPAEKKEFAGIVKSKEGVFLNFPRVKQQYEGAVQKLEEKKKDRDDLVLDLPKLKKHLTKAMDIFFIFKRINTVTKPILLISISHKR